MKKRTQQHRHTTVSRKKLEETILEILQHMPNPKNSLSHNSSVVQDINLNKSTILEMTKTDAEASLLVALLYQYGIVLEENSDLYRKYMQSAIILLKNDSMQVVKHLCDIYQALQSNNHVAVTIAYKKLADMQIPFYIFSYASNVHKGIGEDRNLDLAIKYYAKATKTYPSLSQGLADLKDINKKIKDGKKVEQPLLFRIISPIDNRLEAYMLGTHHRLSVGVFPQQAIKTMFKCKLGFGETAANVSTEEQNQFIREFNLGGKLYLDKYDERWFALLHQDEKINIVKTFNAQFKKMFPCFPKVPKVDNLKLGFVLFVVRMAKAGSASKEAKDFHEDACGHMDKELEQMFNSNDGLEPYFYYLTLLGRQEVDLSDLRKLLRNHSSSEEIESWDGYSRASILYDHPGFYAEEQMDAQIMGESLRLRNEAFCEKMLSFTRKASQPMLFFFGDAHLGGANGMLEQLRRRGFKMELFNPEGQQAETFRPFEYGYRHYVGALQHYKKSIYFGAINRLNMSNCTDIVPYQSPALLRKY